MLVGRGDAILASTAIGTQPTSWSSWKRPERCTDAASPCHGTERATMSKDRSATLRKRVAADPYDAAAWEELVSEADRQRRGTERNTELSAVYEDLLSKFPTAVSCWACAEGWEESDGTAAATAGGPACCCRCRLRLLSSTISLPTPLKRQAGYWREYADHQMSCADEAAVKAVFSRCLLTCLSVDLWRAYLNFIKRVGAAGGGCCR